ncbi:hypothetical protein DL770_002843 [Monosporascus sp. CRB-9-2]|nr:hypothetical protein DL770_002843 [Monosporascus sp. CRB-9-2]
MALCLNSLVTRQLGKLSLGTSLTSVRLNHSRRKRKERVEPEFEPGHGERIWIFSHILDGMTVYSHKPVLKANHALKQIPFNGKKLKPAKIRKDYWRPLAMIQLPPGYGEVGRSVFQRLRECKSLHELAWDDDTLYGEDGRTLTKHERGERLNDQKANTIADMAAVLGGAGKGNKMRLEPIDDDAPEAVELVDARAGKPAKAARASDLVDGLLKTTVFWSNGLDKNFAAEWPANVTHATFEESRWEPLEAEEELAEDAEGQDGDGTQSQIAPPELVANEELHRASEEARRP